MRLLFLGDIVGSCGRDAVVSLLPELREELTLDYVVANGENAAAGKGITKKTAGELFGAGVDVISGGNHMFQHRESYDFLDTEPRVLRPYNYPSGVPGHGIARVGDLAVVNLLGRTFMGEDCGDPFRAADTALAEVQGARYTVVDIHAEATSEKAALGWYLDGRATLVVGTHTHVPTADARLLGQGTAYCTDAGMCGARDSVIGVEREAVIQRFLTQMPVRFPPAEGHAVLNGVLIEASDDGRALSIERCDREIPA